jgi:hypothetical protein
MGRVLSSCSPSKRVGEIAFHWPPGVSLIDRLVVYLAGKAAESEYLRREGERYDPDGSAESDLAKVETILRRHPTWQDGTPLQLQPLYAIAASRATSLVRKQWCSVEMLAGHFAVHGLLLDGWARRWTDFLWVN